MSDVAFGALDLIAMIVAFALCGAIAGFVFRLRLLTEAAKVEQASLRGCRDPDAVQLTSTTWFSHMSAS